MRPEERIWIALDVPGLEYAMPIVRQTRDFVGGYKIGKELFTAEGPRAVEAIKHIGGKVFLDLKYHDIPTTVAKAGVAAARLGVEMFNVHTASGTEMMQMTMAAVIPYRKRPKVLGVTVLTSLKDKDLDQIMGLAEAERSFFNREHVVVTRAKDAQGYGLDGVVCSAKELRAVRKVCGWDFLTMVPGTRSPGAAAHDQKNIETPEYAIANGADYLVIGRQVTEASDVLEELEKIKQEVWQGTKKRFAKDLRRVRAVDFDLVHGWKIKIHREFPNAPRSPFYIDLRLLQSHPHLLDRAADIMAEHIRLSGFPFELICGVPSAATPLATCISQKMGIPMITPRMEEKLHGKENSIDGVWQNGQWVLLIDDIRTTGGSKEEVIAFLKRMGLQVSGVCVLIDRGDGSDTVGGVPFTAVYKWVDVLAWYHADNIVTFDEYSISLDYPSVLAAHLRSK